MDTGPILLVEDTPDDVVLTMRALRQSQIANDVIVARDGVEALDFLQGRGLFQGRDARRLPALILLDLKLPRLGGLEVLQQVQSDQALSAVRVVVLTSSREEEDIVASYSRGACSYVRKPIDYNEFLAAVRRLGEYWLTINESASTATSA